MEKTWTILDIITWGKAYFEEKQIESPRLTIELLLSFVLDKPRVYLYTAFDQPLSAQELSVLRSMVKRRGEREPLQYITGEAYFYDLRLEVSPATLIPRPETELLAEYVIKRARAQRQDSDREAEADSGEYAILDIGTGSGCLGLAIAKNLPFTTLYGIDISDDALEIAARNSAKVGVTNVHWGKIDILRSVPRRKFDAIVANPPYIAAGDMEDLEPEVRLHEPRLALTDESNDGLQFYRRFAEIFPTSLKNNRSWFAVEIGYGQAESVQRLFTVAGFQTLIMNDLANIPRICVGAKEGLA
jgi:release factor glutamine methyltransferase